MSTNLNPDSSSPSTFAQHASTPELSPYQTHSHVDDEIPRWTIEGREIFRRSTADGYPLDPSHHGKDDVRDRESFVDYKANTQHPEGGRRGTPRQNPLNMRRPSATIPPHLLGRDAPTSPLGTQTERGLDKGNPRDLRVRDSQPTLRNGLLKETTSEESAVGYGQNPDTAYQVTRGSEYGTIRNQEAPVRTHVHPDSLYQPPPSEDLEDDDEGSRIAPVETSEQRWIEHGVQVEMRRVDGELQFLVGGYWRATVSLQEIRAQILAQEKRKGTYIHEWTKGKDENDETSYHPWYATWGWKRDQRPAILFQFDRNGYRVTSRHLEIWIYQGRVVVDMDSNPIELWPEIPLLCSSNMSGSELEAIIRTNPDIPLTAIRARMPQVLKAGQLIDPPSLNVLRMRMGRFRKKAGLIAWNEREGSRQIKQELVSILGPRCIRDNSTWSFGRDLTKEEVEKLESVNKGSAPQRSRKKRPAESDNEPLNAPRVKRQNTSPGSLPEKPIFGHAQMLRSRMRFEGQASDPKGEGFSVDSRGQKRHRESPSSDKAEDSLGFPPTKRSRANPDHGPEELQTRLSHEDTGHNLDDCPSSQSQLRPSGHVQVYKRRRGQHWGEENLPSCQDDVNPPMKQPLAEPSYDFGGPRRQHRHTWSDHDLSEVPSGVSSSFSSQHAQEQNEPLGRQLEEENLGRKSDVNASPPEQRPYLDPRNDHGIPRMQRNHGGHSHDFGISSLSEPHVQNRQLNHDRHPAGKKLGAKINCEDHTPSMKQSDQNTLPTWSNQGRESVAAASWRPSQMTTRASSHSIHVLDDEIQFVGSHTRGHLTQPRTIVQPSVQQKPPYKFHECHTATFGVNQFSVP